MGRPPINKNGRNMVMLHPQILKANELKKYNQQLILPALQKMGKKMQIYKEHAAELEVQKLRRKKLDGDIPGQMYNYLNNLNRDFNVLDLKVMEKDNINLQALNNQGRAGSYNRMPMYSNQGYGVEGNDSYNSNFNMPIKKKEANIKPGKDGVTNIDVRPTVNYKLIEPMQAIDPAKAMNKKIDKLNKQREKKFIMDMKYRQDRIEQVRDMMRNLPLPPELPQIYSFTNQMNCPLDFNMQLHHVNERNAKLDVQENAEKINRAVVLPLQNALMQIRKYREEIPVAKLKKANLRDQILKLNQEIKEAEDTDEEDALVEQMELYKSEFLGAKEDLEKQKKQIIEMKGTISSLKRQAVEMLQSLAKKEYMTNPDNIFDFPENNKIRQMSSEIQFEIGKAAQSMALEQQKMMEMMQQQQQQVVQQTKRKVTSDNSSSGSYTETDSDG